MSETAYKPPFTIYEGDNLFEIDEDMKEPLIEGVLYKEDFVQLIAEDKQGKTILNMQMAASLSSGTPFLGVFDVPEAVPIWYFAHEGKAYDMQDRLLRINTGCTVNPDNFTLFSSSRFQWDDENNKETIEWLLDTYRDRLPKVIFIDPLYAACNGNLNDAKNMGDFIKAVKYIASYCGASIVLVHHMKKNQRDDKGQHYTRNDSDGYGSAAFKWAVDHVFFIDKFKYQDKESYDKDNPDRILRCNTQRSGNIASGIRIRLQQGNPLGFHVVEKHLEGQHKIITLLKTKPEGLTNDELMNLSKIKKSSFFTIKNELLANNQIVGFGSRPKKFKLKELV